MKSQSEMMVNGNLKWLKTCWKKSVVAVGALVVLMHGMKNVILENLHTIAKMQSCFR
jgi:hypothetical protein